MATKYNTLLEALEKEGCKQFLEALSREQKTALADPSSVITIFAPTDSAIEQYRKERLSSFLLKACIFDEVVDVEKLVGQTLGKDIHLNLPIQKRGGEITIGSAAIKSQKIMGGKGSVYVIDAVLP